MKGLIEGSRAPGLGVDKPRLCALPTDMGMSASTLCVTPINALTEVVWITNSGVSS